MKSIINSAAARITIPATIAALAIGCSNNSNPMRPSSDPNERIDTVYVWDTVHTVATLCLTNAALPELPPPPADRNINTITHQTANKTLPVISSLATPVNASKTHVVYIWAGSVNVLDTVWVRCESPDPRTQPGSVTNRPTNN